MLPTSNENLKLKTHQVRFFYFSLERPDLLTALIY